MILPIFSMPKILISHFQLDLLMLSEISQHVREKIKLFFLTDNLILNNRVIPITIDNFREIPAAESPKTIAFIDGGQAEILTGGNLSLSFIRVVANIMKGNTKISSHQEEFYILTTATYKQGDIWYEGKIFSSLPIKDILDENDLIISSNDTSIKSGNERGPISKIATIARRFAELRLAQKINTDYNADYVLLDGALEPSFKHEEKYILALGDKAAALAKTCSLFTTGGNSPIVLLQKLSPYARCWDYGVDAKNHFVKLHPQAKHIFRFQGNFDLLPWLVPHSSDPVFLGYPYGLMVADQLARVSNNEKDSLKMSFLLRKENAEIAPYLSAMNAHDILDRMSYGRR